MARAVLRRERGSLGISALLHTRGQVLAGPWFLSWKISLWFLQGQIILPGCGGKGGEPSCPSTVF